MRKRRPSTASEVKFEFVYEGRTRYKRENKPENLVNTGNQFKTQNSDGKIQSIFTPSIILKQYDCLRSFLMHSDISICSTAFISEKYLDLIGYTFMMQLNSTSNAQCLYIALWRRKCSRWCQSAWDGNKQCLLSLRSEPTDFTEKTKALERNTISCEPDKHKTYVPCDAMHEMNEV
ncbi:hypothetical protein EGR_01066 [Echinococcus granulosus]|uniref:Uncharacterized protein n=1 Tax=Echinococcus granulosus TaxID=6210 RepID=W6URU9_ECHGR|nr:hypothetical protein EGR_01066 [Echinococcus granulosus]EUB63938.1 hypothetical protein EGR_01066 [Echinococcus granulosus]